MKCPNCGNEYLSQVEQGILFRGRALLLKSDGTMEFRCLRCKVPVTVKSPRALVLRRDRGD